MGRKENTMDSSNDFAVGYAVGDNSANRNCYGNGMFGADGGFFWIFALLLLPMMTNGGFWGNNGRGEPVTEAGLCNAMNFNNLENAVGRLADQQTQIAMQNQRDLCTGFANTNAAINQARFENQQCCCETKQAIMENRYLAERNTADINANTTAQVQKVLDAICGNRMADMQNQINQLQLQAALCGVIRYPNQTTFNAGFNPFFGGCGCNTGCCGNGNI